MTETASGYTRALSALNGADVDFVVVGVGGINFYARTPAQAFAALDLGALLAPAAENLERALRVLSGLEYVFEARGEPFVDLDDSLTLTRIVERGASLAAIHADGSQLDLMTSISGFRYADLVADATPFDVAGVEVRVGRLEKLLESKQASGRPKDLEFLRAFEARRGDDSDEDL